jgi:hypothetical protein
MCLRAVSDVNPPVHAYATMQIYLTDKERNNGEGDMQFLVYAFSKLLINFTCPLYGSTADLSFVPECCSLVSDPSR